MRRGLVEESLSVQGDQVGMEPCAGDGLAKGIGVDLTQTPGEPGEVGDGRLGGVHGPEHGCADFGTVRKCPMSQKLEPRRTVRLHSGRNAAKGNVDAVCGGARHNAGNGEGLLSRR